MPGGVAAPLFHPDSVCIFLKPLSPPQSTVRRRRENRSRQSSQSRVTEAERCCAAPPSRHRRVAFASSSAATAAREGIRPPRTPLRCLRQLFLHRRRRRESALRHSDRNVACDAWRIGRRPSRCAHAAGRPCRVVHAVTAVSSAVWPLDLTRQLSLRCLATAPAALCVRVGCRSRFGC